MLGSLAPLGGYPAQLQVALHYARRNRLSKVRAEQGNGPTLTVAPAVTGTPQVGQLLTTTNGTWSGSGTVTYSRMWLLNGVPNGATGLTYTPVAADAGKIITVRVSAKDDNGITPAYANSSPVAPL